MNKDSNKKNNESNNSNRNQKKYYPKNNNFRNRRTKSSSAQNNSNNNGNNNNNNEKDTNNQKSSQVKKSYDKKRRSYNYHNRNKKDHNKTENQITQKPIVYDICPICSKEIKDPKTSIPEKESNKNAHFECILRELKKEHVLEQREKLFYLGGGSFGIVLERRTRNNRFTFFIKKRIQYMEKTKKILVEETNF